MMEDSTMSTTIVDFDILFMALCNREKVAAIKVLTVHVTGEIPKSLKFVFYNG